MLDLDHEGGHLPSRHCNGTHHSCPPCPCRVCRTAHDLARLHQHALLSPHLPPKQDLLQGGSQDCAYLTLGTDTRGKKRMNEYELAWLAPAANANQPG